MSKNKNKPPMATTQITPDPFPPADTTKDPPPTQADRQLRVIAGLALFAVGLVAGFGGARNAAQLQHRGLALIGVDGPTLTERVKAILEVVEREWGV